MPVEVGFSRLSNRSAKDRIESEGVDFFERVRERYLIRAGKFPERFRVINANQTLASVTELVKDVLSPLLEEMRV